MSPSKIVVTGTIASGKSTLIELLKEFGFPIISADEINRELLEVGGKNYEAIKNSAIFDQAFDGNSLDKKALAQIIFSNRDKLKILNTLTHKNILEEIDKRAEEADSKVVFIEIPLFFQMEERYEADEVWLLTATYDTQLTRLMARDGIDLDYARTKIETQTDLIKMKSESDVVFDNSSSVEALRNNLENVLKNKDLL